MAALTHRAVADFLRRNEKPEAELIGGELVPKPIGTLDHMRLERRLDRTAAQFIAAVCFVRLDPAYLNDRSHDPTINS